MGNYIPHVRRAPRRRHDVRLRTPAAAKHRDRFAAERAEHYHIEAERRTRMDERRARREREAEADEARRIARAVAKGLFPWGSLLPERRMGAVLSGLPHGSLLPISDFVTPFAGVNVDVIPSELGIAEPFADFLRLSAPRTLSWEALKKTAQFFVASQAIEGRVFDLGKTLTKARAALDVLEGRLSTLPGWLTVYDLDGGCFIIRPTPEVASEMWDSARRRHEVERAS
jgi:hypothetical protein